MTLAINWEHKIMLKWDFSFFTNRDSVNIFIYLIDFDPLEIVELCALALKTFNLYWNKHWERGCLNDWISQYRKSQKRQKFRRKLWHDETPGEQTESGNRCRQNKQKVVFLFSCFLVFFFSCCKQKVAVLVCCDSENKPKALFSCDFKKKTINSTI